MTKWSSLVCPFVLHGRSRQEPIPGGRRPVIRICALLAAVAPTKGCGDGDSTIEPPPDPPRATTVVVSPATAEFAALGASLQLTAEVRDQSGNLMAGAGGVVVKHGCIRCDGGRGGACDRGGQPHRDVQRGIGWGFGKGRRHSSAGTRLGGGVADGGDHRRAGRHGAADRRGRSTQTGTPW